MYFLKNATLKGENTSRHFNKEKGMRSPGNSSSKNLRLSLLCHHHHNHNPASDRDINRMI